MKRILTSIIVLIIFGTNAIAEKKSHKELRGDKYFFVYSFDKAIDSYTKVKVLTVEGQRRLAKSYSNLERNLESEAAYAKLVSMPEGNLPDDYYFYIMTLRTNGKYDMADVWMAKFKQEHPNDLRAKDYAANKWDLSNMQEDNGKYKVQHLDVNTNAEDFGPSYYKDKIVFASTRSISARKYNWNGKSFLDMYVSDVENKQLKTPVVFEKSLDGKMHDGPASFSNNGTFMAFSRNNYDLKRKDKIVRVQICFSSLKDGKWSKPEPYALDNKEYSVGHPSLTPDGKTMYFTSDMPGGYGGVDIYRTKKNTDSTWGKAENLGNKINTEGDELYPFFEAKNGMLFFASNGRYGLGGLDIFICKMEASEYGPAFNAGTPLNTQLDDFAVIVDSNMTNGYFSSNRPGGSGDDDLYSFDILKGIDVGKKVVGIAKDKNGQPIPATFITIQDDKGKTLDSMVTKEDGKYVFYVDSDKNFKLTGKKVRYFEHDTTFNSFSKEYVIKIDLILPLENEATVAQKIKVGSDLGKIAELERIYYDYNKYDIRPDAKKELAKIIKIVNEHPNLVIEMASYADCRASEQYNLALSNRRANASIEYIRKRITNPERVYGKGYGETNLVNTCACEGNVISDCSEAEFQKDRRTEFIIVKK